MEVLSIGVLESWRCFLLGVLAVGVLAVEVPLEHSNLEVLQTELGELPQHRCARSAFP